MAAVVIAALVAMAAAGCGGDDDEPAPATTAPDMAAEPRSDRGGGGRTQDKDRSRNDSGPQRRRGETRTAAAGAEAARAATGYIRAINSRDGERICASLAAGAAGHLPLPRERGDCAASLEASLGYRDPRGLPVWEGSEPAEVRAAEVGGGQARVTITVVTRFADRAEPSIEDDIVYLVRSDDGWLVAKPSATLYRAIGAADIPPDVIAPP